jgi:hypothetical protein
MGITLFHTHYPCPCVKKNELLFMPSRHTFAKTIPILESYEFHKWIFFNALPLGMFESRYLANIGVYYNICHESD